MPTYINGFGGNFAVGANTLPIESWSLNVNAEALDTTNTGDAGWESNITGAKSAEGSVKAYWDSAANPMTAPLSILAGSTATAILNIGSSGKSFTVPARITQVTVENPVKGVVPFNFSFKANGSITYPS